MCGWHWTDHISTLVREQLLDITLNTWCACSCFTAWKDWSGIFVRLLHSSCHPIICNPLNPKAFVCHTIGWQAFAVACPLPSVVEFPLSLSLDLRVWGITRDIFNKSLRTVKFSQNGREAAVHTLDLSWRKVDVKLMMMMMMMKCWQTPEITSFLCSTVLYYVVLCLSTAVLWDSIYSLHGFYSKYVS